MTNVVRAAVVVGVDGSPCNPDAVRMAAREASLRHRPLRLVRAVDATSVGPAVASAERTDREQGRSSLAEAAQIAAELAPEVAISTELVSGTPATVLMAESREAFLLVVSDWGRRRFADLLAGSVTTQATTHDACPVIVVRGRQDLDGPVVVGIDGFRHSMAAVDFAAEEAALRGVDLVALHAWSIRATHGLTSPPRYALSTAPVPSRGGCGGCRAGRRGCDRRRTGG